MRIYVVSFLSLPSRFCLTTVMVAPGSLHLSTVYYLPIPHYEPTMSLLSPYAHRTHARRIIITHTTHHTPHTPHASPTLQHRYRYSTDTDT
ncbi:hypothetical protein C8R47DRAFT_1137865, partial [Mycena vitilis]